MHTTRLVRLAAALVAVAVLAVGCGDDAVDDLVTPEPTPVTDAELLAVLPTLSALPAGWSVQQENDNEEAPLCEERKALGQTSELGLSYASVDYSSPDEVFFRGASLAAFPSVAAVTERVDTLMRMAPTDECRVLEYENDGTPFRLEYHEASTALEGARALFGEIALGAEFDHPQAGNVVGYGIAIAVIIGRCQLAIELGEYGIGSTTPDEATILEWSEPIVDSVESSGVCDAGESAA